MNYQLSGINEAALGELSIEILDYTDRISEIFKKIDDNMYRLGNCYQGKCYDDLLRYYENFRKNYPIIKENIISYSDDLIALVRHMNEADAHFAQIYTNLTNEAQGKTKIIEKL